MQKAVVEQYIECPKCGVGVDWPLMWAVNVAQEPQFKERVLTWKIHLFVCPQCMTEVDLFADFTYYDTNQNFIIMLWSGEDWDAKAIDGQLTGMTDEEKAAHLSMITRRVKTRMELVEKVNIFDAGLDDRVIELLKHTLQEEQSKDLAGAELRFAGAKDGNLRFAVLREDDRRALDLPKGAYDQFEQSFKMFNPPPKNAERWGEIDKAFAEKLMAQVRKLGSSLSQAGGPETTKG